MWYEKSIPDALSEQKVDLAQGLSSQEAQARLEQMGPNKLAEKKHASILQMFLGELNNVLIYVLLAAAAITIFVGEYPDAVIILLVVILNATIGVIQESKAEAAVDALKKMSSPTALVKRDGKIVEIDSMTVVPGDIVQIDAGRIVPADIRLLDSANLQIDESALTGESVPSEKDAQVVFNDPKTPLGDQINMAFMSTVTTYGRGEGVVIGTGMSTEMGKIATSLENADDDQTPLQKKLDKLGGQLGIMAVGICVVIFIIAFFQGRDLFEMFLTAISLAVAAIPEGLAAIVAIVLALGVTRMSKINAIVKRLPAVETLGSVSVICSDKTGTLTQNKMTVTEYFTADGNHPADAPLSAASGQMIRSFVLSSDATHENGQSTGDPTEVALIVLGQAHQLDKKDLDQVYPRRNEYPFDSERKLMSTLTEHNREFYVHTKGALDVLMHRCTHVLQDGATVPFTPEIRERFQTAANEMSDKALRTLGVAYKPVSGVIPTTEMEKDLILLGFVGMIDPPREEVKASIAGAKEAGVTSMMITGDHPNTAFAIAKYLGIAETFDQVVTGPQLDDMSDDDLAKKVKNIRVFARVSPEHKVRIVQAVKANGLIVSMTGDGVNDAPALKNADIGVAMGITGTDVSKGAADMILTDDNFSTIVNAIEEGRNIYNNIRKSVVFLLTCNIGEVMAILVSILMVWPIPLLPTQILWINLVTDSLPALALGVDPGDKDVMKQKPRDPNKGFFANGAVFRIALGGVLVGFVSLLSFYLGILDEGYNILHMSSQAIGDLPEEVITHGRTMCFLTLAMSQLFFALSVRNDHKSLFNIGLFSNMPLIGAILVGIALQLIVIYIPFFASAFGLSPLDLISWGQVTLTALAPMIINEIRKLFIRDKVVE